MQDAQVSLDRQAGRSLALTTIDTHEHAQFAREQLGPALARLQALGWEGKAPEHYEATP